MNGLTGGGCPHLGLVTTGQREMNSRSRELDGFYWLLPESIETAFAAGVRVSLPQSGWAGRLDGATPRGRGSIATRPWVRALAAAASSDIPTVGVLSRA